MLAYQCFRTKEKSVLVITLGSADRGENSGLGEVFMGHILSDDLLYCTIETGGRKERKTNKVGGKAIE